MKIKEKKRIKTLANRAEKNFFDTNQKSVASLFSKDFLNEKPKYKLNEIVKMENKFDRHDLI